MVLREGYLLVVDLHEGGVRAFEQIACCEVGVADGDILTAALTLHIDGRSRRVVALGRTGAGASGILVLREDERRKSGKQFVYFAVQQEREYADIDDAIFIRPHLLVPINDNDLAVEVTTAFQRKGFLMALVGVIDIKG